MDRGFLVGAVARQGERALAGREALLSLLALEDAPFTFTEGEPGEDRSLVAPGASLLEELAEELNRARASDRERLFAANGRLHLERALLEFYALLSTDLVRPLLASLQGGAAPRELLVRGDVSPILVDWVVNDLLRKRIARFYDEAA